MRELHGKSMNAGKSGEFQEYFIKIPGVFQEFLGDKSFSRSFQSLENLKIKFQDFPGVSRSCTNPATGTCHVTHAFITVNVARPMFLPPRRDRYVR
jgi:hypothetical protein